MTRSAVSCRFGHIYWRNPYWKTLFFVQCKYIIPCCTLGSSEASNAISNGKLWWSCTESNGSAENCHLKVACRDRSRDISLRNSSGCSLSNWLVKYAASNWDVVNGYWPDETEARSKSSDGISDRLGPN